MRAPDSPFPLDTLIFASPASFRIAGPSPLFRDFNAKLIHFPRLRKPSLPPPLTPRRREVRRGRLRYRSGTKKRRRAIFAQIPQFHILFSHHTVVTIPRAYRDEACEIRFNAISQISRIVTYANYIGDACEALRKRERIKSGCPDELNRENSPQTFSDTIVPLAFASHCIQRVAGLLYIRDDKNRAVSTIAQQAPRLHSHRKFHE